MAAPGSKINLVPKPVITDLTTLSEEQLEVFRELTKDEGYLVNLLRRIEQCPVSSRQLDGLCIGHFQRYANDHYFIDVTDPVTQFVPLEDAPAMEMRGRQLMLVSAHDLYTRTLQLYNKTVFDPFARDQMVQTPFGWPINLCQVFFYHWAFRMHLVDFLCHCQDTWRWVEKQVHTKQPLTHTCLPAVAAAATLATVRPRFAAAAVPARTAIQEGQAPGTAPCTNE